MIASEGLHLRAPEQKGSKEVARAMHAVEGDGYGRACERGGVQCVRTHLMHASLALVRVE